MIGDPVNLGSRFEGLSKAHGIEIVASESTRRAAQQFASQELDRVRARVRRKRLACSILCRWPSRKAQQEELAWGACLKSCRAQDWDQCDVLLPNLQCMNAKKYLYEPYSERVASMRLLPLDRSWGGATNFDTK